MMIRPIGDRVLIIPDEPQTETASGLAIVSDHNEYEMSGTVAFLGPGPRCPTCSNRLRNDLKIGDRVAFAPNRGAYVDYDGQRFIVVDQADIVGIEDA